VHFLWQKKGQTFKKYSLEFKLSVILDMREHHLSYCETARKYDLLQSSKGGALHMISLSSILETTHRISNLDYMYLFQVIKEICVDQEDLYEAYRRMCFNVFYGNRDDHGKNFAFLYNEEKIGYELSPAYDITPTSNKAEHEMAVLGNGCPTENDLLKIAKEIKLSVKECKKFLKL